jgi:hypothetical protein
MKILIRRWLDRRAEQRKLLEEAQDKRQANAAVIAAQLIASAITRPGIISEPIPIDRIRNFGAVSPRLVRIMIEEELERRTQSFQVSVFSDISSSSIMWVTACIVLSTGYKPHIEK